MDPERLYAGIAYYESKMTHIQSTCQAAVCFRVNLTPPSSSVRTSQEWPADDDVF
jgi:hypothetical protein